MGERGEDEMPSPEEFDKVLLDSFLNFGETDRQMVRASSSSQPLEVAVPSSGSNERTVLSTIESSASRTANTSFDSFGDMNSLFLDPNQRDTTSTSLQPLMMDSSQPVQRLYYQEYSMSPHASLPAQPHSGTWGNNIWAVDDQIKNAPNYHQLDGFNNFETNQIIIDPVPMKEAPAIKKRKAVEATKNKTTKIKQQDQKAIANGISIKDLMNNVGVDNIYFGKGGTTISTMNDVSY